jgi:TorA maturation chaperone TorD
MSGQLKPSDADLLAIAITGRTLGALFFYSPDDASVTELYSFLQQPEWVEQWPCGAQEALYQAAKLMQQGLVEPQNESVHDTYQRLFIGPNSLPAPPWGSVYLDRESVIFGESTLALRQWQSEVGIEVQLNQREPEDHIGLLLMQASWLTENDPERLSELLQRHLLPWSSRYLSLLDEHAHHPFFQGLARLTQLTLDDWQQRLSITADSKQLYF